MGMADGRVVLVTGAGGGIGRAAAGLFAEEGAAHVALADRDEATANDTADLVRASGAGASVHVFDVTDEQSVAAFVDRVVADQGRIHSAFNNAGISHPSVPFHELAREAWDEMLEVNLTSVFLCMKHEIRQMLDTGTAGAIVNTSSGAGVVPAPGQPHYTAAEHAVLGLTRCAASEYVKSGSRCNSILPGMVDTPMLTGGTGVLGERAAALLARVSPTGELLQPAQIAAVAVWLCSDSADAVNGQAIVADGGGIMR